MKPFDAEYRYVDTKKDEKGNYVFDKGGNVEQEEHRIQGIVMDVITKTNTWQEMESVSYALFAAKTEGGYMIFLYPIEDVFVSNQSMRDYVNSAR